jgi:hypothetical protein
MQHRVRERILSLAFGNFSQKWKQRSPSRAKRLPIGGCSVIVSELAKPTPATVGLAWDGSRLWAGDWEARSIAPLDANYKVTASFEAPGRVYGLAFGERTLHAVIGHPDSDDRSIHTFDPASSTWEKRFLRCPDSTGSHLAWDGGHLWLSQRYAKRLLQLHPDGTIKHVIELPWEVTGFTWRGATAWLNVRPEKGRSSLSTLAPGADRPDVVEHFDSSLASLADDGSGLWMSQLKGEKILRCIPSQSPMPAVTPLP